MTTNHKTMAEIRDAEWEKYKDLHPPKGQANFYYKDNAEYFKAGFDASSAEWKKIIEPLLEALSYYADDGNWAFVKNDKTPMWAATRILDDSSSTDNLVGGERARSALIKYRDQIK